MRGAKKMTTRPRKLMSNIVQFLDIVELDRQNNQNKLIEQAKKIMPFSSVIWSDPQWNITEAVKHKTRGHETRKTKYLNFYRNLPNNDTPLNQPFSDIVKAVVTLRFHRGGQGASNLQQFIDGWRYIYDELHVYQYRVELITTEILEKACRKASVRLGAGTAYNIHKFIHEIADLIDVNKLAKIHLGYRFASIKRPIVVSGVGYVRLDDTEIDNEIPPKNADDSVLEALGILYRKIPAEALADRVRILIITLAVFLGRRIGEILTMPAIPVQRNENNTPYVVTYPQKWAQGDMVVKKDLVPLPTECTELIEAVINELLDLTKSTRAVANYIHENGHADYTLLKPYETQGWMSAQDIENCFGISPKNGNHWARTRNLVSIPRPNHINPRTICWTLDKIKEGMNQDIDIRPVVTSASGNLYHKDCFAILPLNACHSQKATFYYAIRLIDWQQMSDFLGSNLSRRQGESSKTLSVFDKYLATADSHRLSVNSHAFRHTLNTWLDEGGMSDTAQTRWFGRKNPRDTKAYQNTSPAKTALLVREDLLKGSVVGPVAEQLKFIPIEAKDAYIKARIRAVHDVGPGLCFHDFSQMPCERSLQCSAECSDYHWRSDDVGRLEDVKRQYAITWLAKKLAEEKSVLGRGKSRDWTHHNNKKLGVHLRQLQSMGVSNFDPEQYITEQGMS